MYETEGELQIEFDGDAQAIDVCAVFCMLLNNREDGSQHASRFVPWPRGTGIFSVNYADRRQVSIVSDGGSVLITDDHEGVGIQDVCHQYGRLCETLKVSPETYRR
jgi:hypothetical protein